MVEKVGLNNLPDFIIRWRKMFLESMQPVFLPEGWKVDHRVVRSFGQHSKFYQKSLAEQERLKKLLDEKGPNSEIQAQLADLVK